jgi:peptidoglycan/xylan/chitin deacetylase (PgdA/CDA1 family)
MFISAMFHFIRNKNKSYKVNFFREKKFSYILKKKFNNKILDPEKLLQKKKFDKNKLLLTFDDGYQDHYNIFKKYDDKRCTVETLGLELTNKRTKIIDSILKINQQDKIKMD